MAWVRAFPDARITVHNEIVRGEWVVQEFTFTGTHEDTRWAKENGREPSG